MDFLFLDLLKALDNFLFIMKSYQVRTFLKFLYLKYYSLDYYSKLRIRKNYYFEINLQAEG